MRSPNYLKHRRFWNGFLVGATFVMGVVLVLRAAPVFAQLLFG